MSSRTSTIPDFYYRYKRNLTKAQLEIYEYLLSTIEQNAEFREYAKKYNKNLIDAYTDNMYSTVNYKMCLLREAIRIDELELFSSKRKEVILDIGCGAGYFSWFAKMAGHTVYSLDAPLDTCGKEIFLQGQKVFRLDMLYHTIHPFEPLPELPQPCTLAVTFSPHFSLPSTKDFWREPAWRYFLADLASRMSEDGKMYFHLNSVHAHPEFGVFGTAETERLFHSVGTVRGYIVSIDARNVRGLSPA